MMQGVATRRAPRLRTGARPLVLGGLALLTMQGAFSLATRVVGGEGDVVHPLIHLLSGALGLALVRRPRWLARFTLSFGAAYLLVLGVGGATGAVDLYWLPLGFADHVFHVVVGSAAVLAVSVAPPPAQDPVVLAHEQ